MSNGIQQTALPALHWILSRRLKRNKTWNNVTVIVKHKTFEIRWVDPKKVYPKGKRVFCSRVLPLSKRSLNEEIERQIEKYMEEKGG